MISLKELVILIIGIATFMFVLGVLNSMFESPIPYLQYIGTPMAFGVFVILFGCGFLAFLQPYLK